MAKITATYNSYTLNDISWTGSLTKVTGKNDEVVNYRKAVQISALVLCASASAQSTAIAAVQTAFTKNGKDLTIGDGSSTLFSLTAALCKGGGPTVDYEIPKDERKVGFNFPVVVAFEGLIDPIIPDGSPTNVLADDTTTRYGMNKQGLITRVKRGKIRVASGQDVNDFRDTVDPGTSTDAFMSAETSFSGYTRVSSSWQPDEDGESAEYEFTDEGYWEEPISDLKDYDLRVNEASDGLQKTITISGTAAGDSTVKPDDLPDRVDELAREQLPEGAKILTKRIDLNRTKCSASFSFEAQAPIGDDVIERTHRISRRTVGQIVFHPYAGAEGGVKQTLGSAFLYATESGRLVGLNSAPTPPDPSVSSMTLIAATADEEDPVEGVDGKLRYVVTYSYEYQDIRGGWGGSGGGSSGSGFSTEGLINGIAGGLAGDRTSFASFSGR